MPACPACGAEAHICRAHPDGAWLHCSAASLHNFPAHADEQKDS